MAILGIDPGKRQSWWALLEPHRKNLCTSWQLLDSGHLDFDPSSPLPIRLPVIYGQIAERFISRPGRGMGNVAEVVNLLLGILYCQCRQRKIPWMYVMPSVHKLWWDRTFLRSTAERWPQLNDHEADACSLAIFGHYHPQIL